jgi:hypothetical protein
MDGKARPHKACGEVTESTKTNPRFWTENCISDLKSFHPIPYIARPCYDESLYWPIVADTSGRAAGHFRCRASD